MVKIRKVKLKGKQYMRRTNYVKIKSCKARKILVEMFQKRNKNGSAIVEKYNVSIFTLKRWNKIYPHLQSKIPDRMRKGKYPEIWDKIRQKSDELKQETNLPKKKRLKEIRKMVRQLLPDVHPSTIWRLVEAVNKEKNGRKPL